MPAANPFPGVSIIMPTFNRAQYIIETIESIQKQTFSNWELLIMDNGSEDNTWDLVTKVNDKRIRLYKTEKRLGIAGTRNEGLKKAKAELVAFIDSDDLWATTKLEKQVAALEQYPGAGFSLTGGFNFKDQLKPVDHFYKQAEGLKYDNLLIPFFRSELSTTISSLIFRKQCLTAIGPFDETKLPDEVELILKLARYFKGIILYEPLLYRRLHDSNDSNANWVKGYHHGVEMIRAYEKELPAEVAKQALFRLYMNFGEDYLLHKEKAKAMQQFLIAWKNKPFSFIPIKKISKAILR